MSTADKRKNTYQSHLQLIGAYFKLNLSASMEYRTSFLIQVFGMFINNLSFAFFWWLLFERFGKIGTYGYNDVLLLWAFSSAGFGLCFIFFGNIRYLVGIIVRGELDTFLLQPKNVLLNTISSKTVVSAWGDLVYGILLFLVVGNLSFKSIAMFILFSITAGLLFSSVLIAYNSAAFYYGNIQSLANLILEFMVTFSIYPADMFHGVVRLMLFTLLPAGFISMVPVSLLSSFHIGWFLLLPAVTMGWMAIAYFLFFRGLKHYESGNLIVNRM